MNEKRKRPHYTKGFKQDAIRLVIDQGYSGPEAARCLGISSSYVTRWVRQHRQNHQDLCESGISRRKPEAEIRRFRKENKQLEMEHEIFKKATAVFAKKSN